MSQSEQIYNTISLFCKVMQCFRRNLTQLLLDILYLHKDLHISKTKDLSQRILFSTVQQVLIGILRDGVK